MFYHTRVTVKPVSFTSIKKELKYNLSFSIRPACSQHVRLLTKRKTVQLVPDFNYFSPFTCIGQLHVIDPPVIDDPPDKYDMVTLHFLILRADQDHLNAPLHVPNDQCRMDDGIMGASQKETSERVLQKSGKHKTSQAHLQESWDVRNSVYFTFLDSPVKNNSTLLSHRTYKICHPPRPSSHSQTCQSINELQCVGLQGRQTVSDYILQHNAINYLVSHHWIN